MQCDQKRRTLLGTFFAVPAMFVPPLSLFSASIPVVVAIAYLNREVFTSRHERGLSDAIISSIRMR